MQYDNATYFGHIRPSLGNTFIRNLMHCLRIKYHLFRYVVDVTDTSMLQDAQI
jgi:hypothetical protein